ncbi:MAG: outer membrane protein assembly factor BamD [Terriglobales bacterium]
MSRRIPVIILLGALLFCAACTNKKVNNPLANVGSKQPDKVLFDRAMDALKHNRFDVARMTLQTLINTYPDSEFIARAKLAVGDSWYAEGGTAALAQAEIEYKDFETFFPNMPEAAEAQLKIANIHYQQMEKPDRDYTHAKRAEDEYRSLILQYPDSKLLPEAKQRLLEVQEVLGEREFEIGRFYYLRQSYPAAIARLTSLVERYPLYSHADEALYLLGESYEAEVTILRSKQFNEVQKARAIEAYTKRATDAYSKILTRYPVMERAEDAKRRLEALHRPVPTATPAAIAQNKAEEESRQTTGMVSHVLSGFKKHPDVARATKVGEPPLVDPKGMSATEVPKIAAQALMGTSAPGEKSIAVEIPKEGAALPAPNESAPRSDSPSTAATDVGATPPAAADSNELQPNTAPASNELKVEPPDGGQAVPPPAQVNEIQTGTAAQPVNAATSSSNTPSGSTSTSKKKKKKGLGKLNPF